MRYFPTRFPGFDSGFWGKHCVYAFVPGWGSFNNIGYPEIEGSAFSHGRSGRILMEVTQGGSDNTIFLARGVAKLPGGGGPIPTAFFTPTSNSSGRRYLYTGVDKGPQFPDPSNMSLVGLWKPTGDGRAGNPDPRIWSKDIGTAGPDHDLMIGIATNGNDHRARIRTGGTTDTILLAGLVQDDAWNITSGYVQSIESGTPATLTGCAGYTEDGGYDNQNWTGGGRNNSGYDPRTSTKIGVGMSANANDNTYAGHVAIVLGFDFPVKREEQLKELMYDPGCVFKRKSKYVVVGAIAATGPTIVFGGFGA